jgi:hypothetical protein
VPGGENQNTSDRKETARAVSAKLNAPVNMAAAPVRRRRNCTMRRRIAMNDRPSSW